MVNFRHIWMNFLCFFLIFNHLNEKLLRYNLYVLISLNMLKQLTYLVFKILRTAQNIIAFVHWTLKLDVLRFKLRKFALLIQNSHSIKMYQRNEKIVEKKVFKHCQTSKNGRNYKNWQKLTDEIAHCEQITRFSWPKSVSERSWAPIFWNTTVRFSRRQKKQLSTLTASYYNHGRNATGNETFRAAPGSILMSNLGKLDYSQYRALALLFHCNIWNQVSRFA